MKAGEGQISFTERGFPVKQPISDRQIILSFGTLILFCWHAVTTVNKPKITRGVEVKWYF